MRYMSSLSDQIKVTMKHEGIKENKQIVNKVRISENLTRGSLDNFWQQKLKKSQMNYLDKLTFETHKIDKNKSELKQLENIESDLLERIKNTQNMQQ